MFVHIDAKPDNSEGSQYELRALLINLVSPRNLQISLLNARDLYA